MDHIVYFLWGFIAVFLMQRHAGASTWRFDFDFTGTGWNALVTGNTFKKYSPAKKPFESCATECVALGDGCRALAFNPQSSTCQSLSAANGVSHPGDMVMAKTIESPIKTESFSNGSFTTAAQILRYSLLPDAAQEALLSPARMVSALLQNSVTVPFDHTSTKWSTTATIKGANAALALTGAAFEATPVITGAALAAIPGLTGAAIEAIPVIPAIEGAKMGDIPEFTSPRESQGSLTTEINRQHHNWTLSVTATISGAAENTLALSGAASGAGVEPKNSSAESKASVLPSSSTSEDNITTDIQELTHPIESQGSLTTQIHCQELNGTLSVTATINCIAGNTVALSRASTGADVPPVKSSAESQASFIPSSLTSGDNGTTASNGDNSASVYIDMGKLNYNFSAFASNETLDENVPNVSNNATLDCSKFRKINTTNGREMIVLKSVHNTSAVMKYVTAGEFGVWALGEDSLVYRRSGTYGVPCATGQTWDVVNGINGVSRIHVCKDYVYALKEYSFFKSEWSYKQAATLAGNWTILQGYMPCCLCQCCKNGGWYGIDWWQHLSYFTWAKGGNTVSQSCGSNAWVSFFYGPLGLWAITQSKSTVMYNDKRVNLLPRAVASGYKCHHRQAHLIPSTPVVIQYCCSQLALTVM